MPTPNQYKTGILPEIFENQQSDHFPFKTASNISNVLEELQSLLNTFSGSAHLVKNPYRPLEGTTQYPNNVKELQVVEKLGKIFKVLNSLNSPLQPNKNEEFKLGYESIDNQETSGNPSLIHTFELVINVIAIPVLAFFGCMSCVVGILYLSSGPRRAKLYNLLLSTLFSLDALILFFAFLRGIGYSIRSIFSQYSFSYHIIVSMAIRCFSISSIFMLLSISHARLCAIRNPFQYSSNILPWHERKRIWRNYLIPVIITSLILSFPLAIEFKFPMENNTIIKPIIEPSTTRLNMLYSILYVGVLNLGIIGILPVACLIYFAYHIKTESERNDEVHYGLTQRRSEIVDSSNLDEELARRKKNERKRSRSIFIGIVVFVSLHTFRIVTTFGEFYLLFDPNKDDETLNTSKGVPSWIRATAALSETCMVIDSSIRVLIHLKPDCNTFQGMFRKREEIPVHVQPTLANHLDRRDTMNRRETNITIIGPEIDDMIEVDDTNDVSNELIEEDETRLGVIDSMEIGNLRRRSTDNNESETA